MFVRITVKVTTLLFFIIYPFYESYCQRQIRQPVVLISSGTETGAGIVVGARQGFIYIITAAHVIGNSKEIDLRFFNQTTAKGLLLINEYPSLDIAILRCIEPPDFEISMSYMYNLAKPYFRQKVGVIGHPAGDQWDIDFGYEVKEPVFQYNEALFAISRKNIYPGHSGRASSFR